MNYYKNLKITYKIPLIISTLLLLTTAATAYYADFQSLTIWSINIWDNLYTSGNPLNFYACTAQIIYGAPHATVGSDVLVYIPWAIWNLPLWILQRFFGLLVLEHSFMLFYSKCFLLILIVGCAIMMRKIAMHFDVDMEHTNSSIFLFVSGFLHY